MWLTVMCLAPPCLPTWTPTATPTASPTQTNVPAPTATPSATASATPTSTSTSAPPALTPAQLERLPRVFQWNKRDLPVALPIESLRAALNPGGAPEFEAVACEGRGVSETLRDEACFCGQGSHWGSAGRGQSADC